MVATISGEKKADTVFQVEGNGDDVSAISNTRLKMKQAQEDLATIEVNEAGRKQNSESEVSIKEEEVDEKASTAAVDSGAPSATLML